jgi:hypothetical protein
MVRLLTFARNNGSGHLDTIAIAMTCLEYYHQWQSLDDRNLFSVWGSELEFLVIYSRHLKFHIPCLLYT